MNATQVLIVLFALTQFGWQAFGPSTPPGREPSPRVMLALVLTFFAAAAFSLRGLAGASPRLRHLTPVRRRLVRGLWEVVIVTFAIEMLPRLSTGLVTGTMPTEWSFWNRALDTVGRLALFATMFVLAGEPFPGLPPPTTGRGRPEPRPFEWRVLPLVPAAFGLVCLAGGAIDWVRGGVALVVLEPVALVSFGAALVLWGTRPSRSA